MGAEIPGGYKFDEQAASIQTAISRALTYPAATAQDAGKVPTVQIDGTIAFNTPAADPPYVPITLAAANWSNGSQTVTVTGVSATETDQLIQPVPALVSQSAYLAAGILVTAQAANSLTFTCTETPSSDLTVYVVLTDLEAAS